MRKGFFLHGIPTGIIILALMVVFSGCTDITYNFETPEHPAQADQFEVVRVALDGYLSSNPAPVILAGDLFDNLNDDDTSNDPVIISVRPNDLYQVGHIPGAINISWKEIAFNSSLAKIPAGKDVVVYCNTGHTAGVATTILNALGYNAKNLKFGICAWTQEAEVLDGNCFDAITDAHSYPLETTANTLPATQPLNAINNTTSVDEFEIIRAAAEAYAAGSQPAVMLAEDLNENLNDGDDTNDPLIISVRKAEHYNLGHIPGAINIPWTSSAKVSELTKLPVDAEIVVVCYTGHTSAIATTVLNMLGYDAVNLKFGMCGWTMDTDVIATDCFSIAIANDFPVNSGPNP